MEYQEYVGFLNEHRSENDLQVGIYLSLLNDFRLVISDEFYFLFIEDINNGGFFFNQALQFYSFIEERNFRNISIVNENFIREYHELFKGLVTFGQDIFGNQFAFDIQKGCIVSFDIETAEQKIVAESFKDWLFHLRNNLNYIAGIGYVNEWKKDNDLQWDHRILPKVPFVIGGAYSLENFQTSTFPYYVSYNAQLASQIYNLKDGEKIKLVITKS